MQKTYLTLAISMFGLAACSQTGTSNSAIEAENAAMSDQGRTESGAAVPAGMATVPAGNSAYAYVTNAGIGDMYEIESSRLALGKSQTVTIKTFAQQMITDHTGTTRKLLAAIVDADLRVAPPTQLDQRRQAMLDQLRALSGADFDRAYLDQQTAAHQEALALHGGYAQDGDNAQLRGLAAATAPKIQHHFEMAMKLKSSDATAAR